MRSIRPLGVVLSCFVAGALGCGARVVADGSPQEVAYEVVAASRGQAAAGLTVLTSAAEFETFFGKPAAELVDFEREWVVHFATGPKNTAGFAATIAGIRLDEDDLVVDGEDHAPGACCLVETTPSYPQATVKLKKPITRTVVLSLSNHVDDACADGRTAVVERCAKSTRDACAKDSDCRSGGCGGELCYSPHVSSGMSTCECTRPMDLACGCVAGACSWYR